MDVMLNIKKTFYVIEFEINLKAKINNYSLINWY